MDQNHTADVSVIRAAAMLSGIGRPWRVSLGRADVARIREILIQGRITETELRAFARQLALAPKVLASQGIKVAHPGFDLPAEIVLAPHPSAERVWVQSGIHGGRSLAEVAVSARRYLYRLASDRWAVDPAIPEAALQALLGEPITSVPHGWGRPPEISLRSLVSTKEVLSPPAERPRKESAPATRTPVHGHAAAGESADAFDGMVATQTAIESARTMQRPASSNVRVERDGERLVIEFPYSKSLVEVCKSIRGSEWDSEAKHWSVPLEGAVRLSEEPRIRDANPALIDDLSARYRDVLEARQAMQDVLVSRQIAPARDIEAAQCKRYVVRSKKSADKVLTVFEYNDEIGNWLFQKVEGRYNKAERGYLFHLTDLVVVGADLWRLGFVFEDYLVEYLKTAREQIAKGVEVAKAFDNPLRGADSAELDYIAANGITPYDYQKADIRYALQCIDQVGGVGLFLDMGLGKTVVTSAAYDLLRSVRPDLRVLIFCPRSAFSAWRRELGGMLPADFYFPRLKTGDRGRAAMMQALAVPLDERRPVGAIIAGSKKARAEALQAGPELVVINYDSARSTVEELRDWVRSGGPVLVVADESHRIKEPTTQTSQVVLSLIQEPQISGEGGGRIALSGTPISQGPHEFFTQAAFIDGGVNNARFGPSWRAFCERYFYIDRGPEGKWFMPRDFTTGEKRVEYMDMLAFATVRRKSEEALDLPELTYRLLEAELEGGVEQAAYTYLLEQKKKEVSEMDDNDARSIDPARLSMRMRQIASHPANLLAAYREAKLSEAESEPEVAPLRAELEELLASGVEEDDQRVIAVQNQISRIKIKNDDLLGLPDEIVEGLEAFVRDGKKPVKLELLLDFVEDVLQDESEKIIITCDFDETEKAIYEALKSYKPIWFNASLNDEQRLAAEEAFQKDPSRRILIAKAVTISEGLTLTAARHMVLYDAACGFSTKNWEQVQKRVHRNGQTRKCTINHLAVAGTMDLYGISRVIGRAREASKLLQDSVSSLPEDLQTMLKAGRNFTGKREVLRMLTAYSGKD